MNLKITKSIILIFIFILLLSCTTLKPYFKFIKTNIRITDIIIDTNQFILKIDFNIPVDAIVKDILYILSPKVLINEQDVVICEPIKLSGYKIDSLGFKKIDSRKYCSSIEFVDTINYVNKIDNMLIYIEGPMESYYDEYNRKLLIPADTLLRIQK